MSLNELTQLIPPPVAPVRANDERDLEDVLARWKIEFPREYLSICLTYGSGRFLAGTLEIPNPYDSWFCGWVESELMKLRQHAERRGSGPPVFPDPGGLFPFARDDNGNRFYWSTKGLPDEWAIACRTHEYDWDYVDLSLSSFLVALATNRLEFDTAGYWGEPFPPEHLEFIPASS